jgi:Flp pilus assembly protein CpaB
MLAGAAVLLVLALADRGGHAPPRAQARVQVLVLRRAVAAGQRLSGADLAARSVPVEAASPHQLADAGAAVGRRVAVALAAGSPLMDAELAVATAGAGARDVPLRLDDVAGLPGGDLSGTRADLYLLPAGPVARPRLVLAGALVVAAGEHDGAVSATLRVPAADVASLLAADPRGTLRLVARAQGGLAAG